MDKFLEIMRQSLPEALGGLAVVTLLAVLRFLWNKRPWPTTGMKKFDLYLSHFSGDKLLVEGVQKLLEDAGLHVFIDTKLSPGAQWKRDLNDAMRTSRAVGFCVSSNTRQSSGMQEEIRQALGLRDNLRLIPIILPGASFSDIPDSLQEFMAVDLSAGINSTSAAKLISSLSGGRNT